MKLLTSITIHPLTYLILFISFLAGYFEYVFLLLFIIVFHELGHLFGIILFKYKDYHILLYPLGGLTKYKALVNEYIYKEVIIALLGPLFQVILVIFIYFIRDYISINTYIKFMYLNKLLFSINLLPIYPLDGGKILKLILDYYFPFKISIYISIFISLIVNIFFILLNIIKQDYLLVIIFVFNLKELIIYIKDINNIYNKFLLERYIYVFDFKKGNIINSHIFINKNKVHKINRDNFIFNEKDYLKKYIFNI